MNQCKKQTNISIRITLTLTLTLFKVKIEHKANFGGRMITREKNVKT